MSAWGQAWGRSWANAWGSVVVEVPPPVPADRFDWNAPRLQPATAHPAMLKMSQQQWLRRMQRRR